MLADLQHVLTKHRYRQSLIQWLRFIRRRHDIRSASVLLLNASRSYTQALVLHRLKHIAAKES